MTAPINSAGDPCFCAGGLHGVGLGEGRQQLSSCRKRNRFHLCHCGERAGCFPYGVVLLFMTIFSLGSCN